MQAVRYIQGVDIRIEEQRICQSGNGYALFARQTMTGISMLQRIY